MGAPDSCLRGYGPVGGLVALLVTHTFFSVSSGVGFLALFGVSVQTGVIMLEYINQLRARGYTPADAAVEGAILRLRPIMMTMLVATFGLLPAAMSHAIGSDSQRPFAIVIVGGLISALALSIFLLPTLYAWIAREGDKLPEPEVEESFEHLRARSSLISRTKHRCQAWLLVSLSSCAVRQTRNRPHLGPGEGEI